MATRVLDPFEIYGAVRLCEVGKQLERFLRSLCYILDAWCRFGQTEGGGAKVVRTTRYDKPDNGDLLLIEFDKLANIVFRMWTQMFKSTGSWLLDCVDEPSAEEVENSVRFKPPMAERPGIHGPGMARFGPDDDRVRYLVRMIERLADDEGIAYFRFAPTEVAAPQAGAVGLGPRTSRAHQPHKWIVKSGLPASDDDVFWDGFTEGESAFLRDLANAIKRLGPTEVRALGTHKDGRGTVIDTKRELQWARSARDKLLGGLKSGAVGQRAARQLQVFADEARRKARTNEKDYSNAYRLVLEGLGGDTTKEAFRRCQGAPGVVWGDPELPGLRDEADRLWAVASCLSAISYFGERPAEIASQVSRPARAAMHRWEEGTAAMKGAGETLPWASVESAFDDASGLVRAEVAEEFSRRLSLLLR